MTDASDVRITGAPTAQEVAAVVAALHAAGSVLDPARVASEQLSGYERWRRQRLAALTAGRATAPRTPS